MATSRKRKPKDRVSVTVHSSVTGLERTVDYTKQGAKLRLNTTDPHALKFIDGIYATTSYKELRRWVLSFSAAIDALIPESQEVVRHHIQAQQHKFFYPNG